MPFLSPYALKSDVFAYTADATHCTLIAKEEKMGISFLARNWNSKWGCASLSVDQTTYSCLKIASGNKSKALESTKSA
jgi:hypothetical protein